MKNGNGKETLATKEDLREAVEVLETRMEARFLSLEQRVGQILTGMESNIMTSVYKLAEALQYRLTQTEGNQAAFNARLAALETRITELEKMLNIPPQQMQ